MRCPYCDAEMAAGYIQSGRIVYFTEEPHKFLLMPTKEEITLTSRNWTSPICEAWCCQRCRKIIVEYH